MTLSETTMFALDTAREAADLALRALPESQAAKDVRHKGPGDLITRVDRESERLITQRIRERFPDHGLLAEEGTAHPGTARGAASARWLVDPIDGTSNFAHGLPWFAVSIALEQEGIIQCGAVAVPPLREVFVAERGRGAYLIADPSQPVRLAVSTVREVGLALIATGLPAEPSRSRHVPTIPQVMRSSLQVRIMGSAAAHLACVAAGRLDAYWEPGLNPWDMAAGILLVEEAGGRVSDLAGRPLRAAGGDLLATNGPLHEPLLALVRGH
jgi:myo-inositol-1(or 4)-monophosphatase